MVSTEDVDRLLWCQNLYIAHFTLYVVHSSTAFFSHIFRSAMIRFADRGLVLQGRPNLKLFSQLFWLILIPYCCIGLMMAPFRSIIRGSFDQKFVAKLCLQPPGFNGVVFEEHQEVMKQVVVPIVSPLLILVWCQYMSYKVRKYFRGSCPNKKMFSFGNYRRNFITFEENIKYIQTHFVYWIIIDLVLTGSKFSWAPQKIFWVQNTLNFFYFDIFHGLFLPGKMIIPRNVNVTKPFWKTESIPEPRRNEQILDSMPVSKPLFTHVGPFLPKEMPAGPSFGQIVSSRCKTGQEKQSDANVHLVIVDVH